VAVVLAELPAVLAERGPPAFRELPLLQAGRAA
jgi:hypothetical protein